MAKLCLCSLHFDADSLRLSPSLLLATPRRSASCLLKHASFHCLFRLLRSPVCWATCRVVRAFAGQLESRPFRRDLTRCSCRCVPTALNLPTTNNVMINSVQHAFASEYVPHSAASRPRASCAHRVAKCPMAEWLSDAKLLAPIAIARPTLLTSAASSLHR